MIVTPEFLDDFRKDFDNTVEMLRQKYDISIFLGPITYTNERFSATLNVNMTRDPEDIARANFDAEAWKFQDIGITEGMYKRIFIGRNGKRYAVVALRPRTYKPLFVLLTWKMGNALRRTEALSKNGPIRFMLKSWILNKLLPTT